MCNEFCNPVGGIGDGVRLKMSSQYDNNSLLQDLNSRAIGFAMSLATQPVVSGGELGRPMEMATSVSISMPGYTYPEELRRNHTSHSSLFSCDPAPRKNVPLVKVDADNWPISSPNSKETPSKIRRDIGDAAIRFWSAGESVNLNRRMLVDFMTQVVVGGEVVEWPSCGVSTICTLSVPFLRTREPY